MLRTVCNNLIPANGWAAVYESNGNTTALPLVGWVNGAWWYEADKDEVSDASEGHPYHETFGLVVSNGKIVPARTLPDFVTYDYDIAATATDYLDMKDD